MMPFCPLWFSKNICQCAGKRILLCSKKWRLPQKLPTLDRFSWTQNPILRLVKMCFSVCSRKPKPSDTPLYVPLFLLEDSNILNVTKTYWSVLDLSHSIYFFLVSVSSLQATRNKKFHSFTRPILIWSAFLGPLFKLQKDVNGTISITASVPEQSHFQDLWE